MSAALGSTLISVALLLSGCASVSGWNEGPLGGAQSASRFSAETQSRREITVFAAASLAEVFAEVQQEFEQAHPEYDLVLNFAGSNTLALQIVAGARADLIASADATSLERLRAADLIEPPVEFALNRLALAVPQANPARIRGIDDLLRPGTRLVLAGPEVPAGRYGREYLRGNGGASVLERPISEESDVRGVVGKLLLEEADAGVVYHTDLVAMGERLRAVPVAEEVEVLTRYPLARLREAREPEGAAALLEFLVGDEGRRMLEAQGFLLP